jgi:hypothetical protein
MDTVKIGCGWTDSYSEQEACALCDNADCPSTRAYRETPHPVMDTAKNGSRLWVMQWNIPSDVILKGFNP